MIFLEYAENKKRQRYYKLRKKLSKQENTKKAKWLQNYVAIPTQMKAKTRLTICPYNS